MEANSKPNKNARNQLLVEGPDDLHTITNLVQKSGIIEIGMEDRLPYIPEFGQDEGGLEKLFSRLEVLYKRLLSIDAGSLGIVVDANGNPLDRWKKIRDWFSRSGRGVILPNEPQPGGVVVPFRNEQARIGVWMMPDNQSAGCLEHFLEKLIPVSPEGLWEHAQKATSEAANLQAPFWSTKNENTKKKAEVHTWLAWQENPGQPFGIALASKVFRHDPQEATQFLAWFRRLFLES